MKEWLLEELENEVVSLFDYAEKNYRRIKNPEEKLQMQNVLLTYRQYFDQIFFLLQELRPKIQKIFKEECTSILERIHLIKGEERVSNNVIYEVLDGILQDIAIMCVVVPDYFLEMRKQEEMEEIKEDVFKYVEEESSVITKAEYTLLNKITELIRLKRKWQINKKAEIVYLDEMEVW